MPVYAQSKNWTGTLFDLVFPDVSAVCTYACYQQEVCPESGRLHWQWFVQFKERLRLPGVKKVLGATAHCEVAKSIAASRAYCMKEATRVPFSSMEIGVWAGKEDVIASLRQKRAIDVVQENPHLWRSFRALSDLRSALLPDRTEETKAYLFTGSTGKGKTRIAAKIAEFLGADAVYWQDCSQWWPKYEQQELVVVDEYRGQFSPDQLLRMIDRVPYRVATKGGHVPFASKHVIFTSNLSLRDMYPNLDERTLCALRRRIVEITMY